jgi:hypothetical protein
MADESAGAPVPFMAMPWALALLNESMHITDAIQIE